ncbi:MAG: rhodanese-like domain-containing protein [Deltaproteobacteria bacterium]|jgi:rhodanese-related sulfurtransferase|nr:rhodanese-like domain-containing protein [Deltaproteobacteria bacterium]
MNRYATKISSLITNLALKELLFPTAILLALAASSGFLINHVRGPEPAAPGLTEITQIAELEKILFLPQAILLDARDPVLYSLGHIPGALNLPAEDLAPRLEPFLTELKNKKLDGPYESLPIVTYCSETFCPLAKTLAGALIEAGLKNVYVFSPGFDFWLENDGEIEK